MATMWNFGCGNHNLHQAMSRKIVPQKTIAMYKHLSGSTLRACEQEALAQASKEEERGQPLVKQ